MKYLHNLLNTSTVQSSQGCNSKHTYYEVHQWDFLITIQRILHKTLILYNFSGCEPVQTISTKTCIGSGYIASNVAVVSLCQLHNIRWTPSNSSKKRQWHLYINVHNTPHITEEPFFKFVILKTLLGLLII